MVKMIGDAKMIQDVDPTHKKQFVKAGWAELVEAPQKFKEPEIKEEVKEPVKEEINPPKNRGGRPPKKI